MPEPRPANSKLTGGCRWRFLLPAGWCVVALALAPIWRPALVRYLALHSATPAYAALESRREAAAIDLLTEVRTLWAANHLPQRLFAIALAREACVQDRSRVAALRPLLLSALNDVDSDLRDLAGHILMLAPVPADLEHVLPLLTDADPQVRRDALELLRLTNDIAYTRLVTARLDDADPGVVMAATVFLRKLHGADFGARGNVPMTDNRAAFDAWRQWARQHQGGFPPAPSVPALVRPSPIPAPAGVVYTLGGRRLDLGQLRGQAVILHFWHTRLARTHILVATLRALERRYPGRITVVNVLVDAVPTEHEYDHALVHDPHRGDGDEPTDNEELLPDRSAAATLQAVETFCREHDLTGTVVLDSGALSTACVANELPTTVMIAPDGMVTRRFSGARSAPSLDAMFQETYFRGSGTDSREGEAAAGPPAVVNAPAQVL